MQDNEMLKEGIYKAVNNNSLWDMYEITIEVKETEKSFIFRLIEFESRYSGAHIEMLFKKSKRVVIQKNKGGHCMCKWSDHDFTFYPYQEGVPYYFKMVGSESAEKQESEAQVETNADVIRRMTNEQLAEFISRVEFGDFSAVYGVTFCDLCQKDGNSLNLDCDGCLKHWLDSPATDCFGILYETGGKDVENPD